MSEITFMLKAVTQGKKQAAEERLPLVYEELRRLAAVRMSHEAAGHTLQPTALVHEAWLHLARRGKHSWQNRADTFGAAAMATHRITMANLDKFSYIGLFSGSTIAANEMTDAAAFKANVKALFLSCDDRVNPTALQTSQAYLAKLGVKSTIFVQPNAQHEWRVWHASLIQFLPLLFQER